MDGKKWRKLSLVFTRESADALEYLSELSGQSKSEIVREMLGDSLPALSGALRQALTTKDPRVIHETLGQLFGKALSQLTLSLGGDRHDPRA